MVGLMIDRSWEEDPRKVKEKSVIISKINSLLMIRRG